MYQSNGLNPNVWSDIAVTDLHLKRGQNRIGGNLTK